MDRRSFMSSIFVACLLPGQNKYHVSSHPNPCEKLGFHRCYVSMVRGFSIVDCDVKLPFGIYATDVRIELACMRAARDIISLRLGKRDTRHIEESLKNGLIDVVHEKYGHKWFYLKSSDENWHRSAAGYWEAELWASDAFGDLAIKVADFLTNKFLEDNPVPEIRP